MKTAFAAVLAGALLVSTAWAATGPPKHLDAEGRISLPADFRIRHVHLGSWVVIDNPTARGLHDV